MTDLNEIKNKLVNEFVANNLKNNQNADITVLQFIADFMYVGHDKNNMMRRADYLTETFRAGYCYYFAHILQKAFPNGSVCWAAPFGHLIFMYAHIPYDIEGVYVGEAEYFIPEEYLGRTVEDFLHIRGVAHNATEQELTHIIEKYKKDKLLNV